MKSFVFALMFLMPFYAIGGDIVCKTENGTTNTETRRECYWKKLQITEDQLNETYDRVLERYTELAEREGSLNRMEEVRSTLVAAQWAWMAFREADCRVVYIGAYGETPFGGPMADAFQGACKQTLAKERIRQLEATRFFIEKYGHLCCLHLHKQSNRASYLRSARSLF